MQTNRSPEPRNKMKIMKSTLMLNVLALTPALLAGEPTVTTPAPAVQAAPAAPEDIAEEAALVQQIGEEAARGFDPEAHAHALRTQIEALVSTPLEAMEKAAAPASVLTSTNVSNVVAVKPAARPSVEPAPAPLSRDAAIREAIQKMRAALEMLDRAVGRHTESR